MAFTAHEARQFNVAGVIVDELVCAFYGDQMFDGHEDFKTFLRNAIEQAARPSFLNDEKSVKRYDSWAKACQQSLDSGIKYGPAVMKPMLGVLMPHTYARSHERLPLCDQEVFDRVGMLVVALKEADREDALANIVDHMMIARKMANIIHENHTVSAQCMKLGENAEFFAGTRFIPPVHRGDFGEGPNDQPVTYAPEELMYEPVLMALHNAAATFVFEHGLGTDRYRNTMNIASNVAAKVGFTERETAEIVGEVLEQAIQAEPAFRNHASSPKMRDHAIPDEPTI